MDAVLLRWRYRLVRLTRRSWEICAGGVLLGVVELARDGELVGASSPGLAGSSTYLVINRHQPLRHPVERHHPVGRLLDAVESPADVLLDRLGVKD